MFGKKLLSDITPKDVERALLPKHAPATRNRALCAFRGLFGWAVRQGLLEKDPTAGMPKEHETARTRVLSDEEIRVLIEGFDQTRYGRALRLLFLTALRRDEVLGLKWSWIDLERGVLTSRPAWRRLAASVTSCGARRFHHRRSRSWPSNARLYSGRA
jgi:integrase